MKIGIMTLWGTDENYGAVLQCYALQAYLRKLGHDPFLIRYKEVPTNKVYALRAKISKLVRNLRHFYIIDKPRHFNDFKKKYIKQSQDYESYISLKENPPEADAYIVGSDQVWNFYNVPIENCADRIHAYFLDFGNEKIRRLSYAASWTRKYVTDDQIDEIKPLIHRFDYISVREESGLEMCRICDAPKAELVPDPTLLLNAEDYRNLYKNTYCKTIYDRFLLIYLVLARKNSFDLDRIYEFAEAKGLEVILVTENKFQTKYKKTYPTIEEWLYLVDNAEYVVTNSFHGSVFSILFHKRFCTIPLTGYASDSNSRIENLFKMYDISPRFINNYDFSIMEEDYHINKKPNNNISDFLKCLEGDDLA